jgi:hypothetical protein
MKSIISITKQLLPITAIAAMFIGTQSAHADLISLNFSYDDNNGLVTGQALLQCNPVPGELGDFVAMAGTIDIAAPTEDGITGDYTLVANPNGTNATYSQTGLFIYDDQITPGGQPIVTNPGLLAYGGLGSTSVPEGKGVELNLFSQAANTYDLYTGANGGYPYSYVFTIGQNGASISAKQVSSGGTSGLVAAPEPATWAIMGSFLLIALCKLPSLKAAREEATAKI